jgi:NADH-quinone oxidoreductase subunit M
MELKIIVQQHLLSLLIWVPIASALLLLLLQKIFGARSWLKWIGLSCALLILVLCVPLYMCFDSSSAALQFSEHASWISALNIHYTLGVDGISVLFIILTAFTNLIIILSAWRYITKRVAEYMAIFLLATGITNGVFAAQDAILFYLFWEASMVPIYLGLGMWGMERRNYAALKFFLLNLLGSLCMLLAFIYFYFISNSFCFSDWNAWVLPRLIQDGLFVGLFVAFAVKMPMWPLHTWFADMHEQAPPGGSIVLAALMLKLGAYGFLRLNLPIVPGIDQGLMMTVIVLSLLAVVYVGFASIAQKDMKRLIAYSSISHMGIATLGIFMVLMIVMHHLVNANFNMHTDALLSLQGAVFQLIAHAFAAGGLFVMVAMLYERFHSSKISNVVGLAKSMPMFAFFFVLFAMANVGLPGTTGFVGEFLVILAALGGNFWIAFIAAFTLILSPAYMLWWVKRSIFGAVPRHAPVVQDIQGIEILLLVLLAVPVIIFGVYPAPILNLSYAANAHIVDMVMAKLPVAVPVF